MLVGTERTSWPVLQHLSGSSSSDTTFKSSESFGVRQPARNKIKRHNRGLATVFRGRSFKDEKSGLEDGADPATDDPTELSTQVTAPGILKIFGDEICAGANYKSVLATPCSSAQELLKEALERLVHVDPLNTHLSVSAKPRG
ncbi:hypothetical protein chiPu_0024277 [Chiloscyllium punctatum]|uniref:Ras-associating domain-containing protein n=1 Tax=Chiloscyllium punctatum TaxID=137246 RepID=A0A401TBP8_CHIPU|nr:hypothetical protein [Chiloscyllium punctatum]